MYQNITNVNGSPMTNIAGTGTSGLQNGIGTGTSLDANRIEAGLPINFFMANPAIAQGNAYLETNGGNTRYNAMQIELRRRMSNGLLVQGSYSYAFGRKSWSWRSLREDWHYVPSTGGPDHAFKLNWVYELPFGQGKKWGSGAGTLAERLHRRLGMGRRHARPDRRQVQLRRLPPGGDVRGRVPGHVQVLP